MLDSFVNRNFRCLGPFCVYCKVSALLNEYKYGDSLSIPPDDLRDALATSISASFKTGNLGDPTEAYTAVLERLCEQLTGKVGENCNAEHCVVHKKFASHVLEHAECPRCGTKQESSQAQWELTRWISAASGPVKKTQARNRTKSSVKNDPKKC